MAADPRLRLDPRRTATPPQPPPPPPPAMLEQQANAANAQAVNGDCALLPRKDEGGYKLKFCTVCASNQNRYASPRSSSPAIFLL